MQDTQADWRDGLSQGNLARVRGGCDSQSYSQLNALDQQPQSHWGDTQPGRTCGAQGCGCYALRVLSFETARHDCDNLSEISVAFDWLPAQPGVKPLGAERVEIKRPEAEGTSFSGSMFGQ